MKKALSILLSGILLMAVITAIPFTASAATDREIDLEKSELLVAGDNTNMVYDAVEIWTLNHIMLILLLII